MLDLYEQKILIKYLINAIEYMRKDSNSCFCFQKVVDLIEVVEKAHRRKKINFNLKNNTENYCKMQPKKLYNTLADDIISQLETQIQNLKTKKISSKEKVFRTLQQAFRLTDNEIEVFKMYYRNELNDTCCDILCLAQRSSGHCSAESMCQHYLHIKNSRTIFDKLTDIGLLDDHRGERGFRYNLPYDVQIIVEKNYSTLNQIYKQLIGPIVKANLKKNDFKHLENEFNTVELILKNAIKQKTKGVNILFYGEVGSGKTEMVKTIAKCLKTRLFEIISEDSDQEEVDREARINDLKRKLAIFSNLGTEQIILFDEAEDIFTDTMFINKTQSKSFVNKILENNEVPVIWTTNDVENMDKAYLRRFIYSVKFEKLNEDIQLEFMKKEFKKHDFKISDDEISKLST